jgi:hypothetical protein
LHWFDDFTKAVAANQPSRSTILNGLARLAAGAAIAPLAASGGAAFADPVSLRARISRGVRHKSNRPNSVQRGPCSFKFSNPNAVSFSVSSSSLTLTLSASLKGHVVDLADGGEPILHVESEFASWDPRSKRAPDATFTFRYGPKVRGISSAVLKSTAGMITGTVDGRALAPFDLRGAAPSSIRLDGGHELAVDVDPGLRAKLSRLSDAVKSGKAACGPRPRRERMREHRSSAANATLLSFARAIGGYDVAQVPVANGILPGYPTGQNTGVADISNGGVWTLNCLDATVTALFDYTSCLAAAYAGIWICPPCALYAIFGCTTAYAGALTTFELPGGACEQVACSSGSPVPNSCDYTFTCCGTQDCCPSDWTCSALGFCCPPGTSVACGTSYENGTCCPSTAVCGPNNTCVSCAQGQIAQNGQCCDFLCGSACCHSGEECDPVAGTCGYPNFGSASPKPTPLRVNKCTHISGTVICQALNADNSMTDLCCAPGLNCCAGQCCEPGDTCGGTGSTLRCGKWIR